MAVWLQNVTTVLLTLLMANAIAPAYAHIPEVVAQSSASQVSALDSDCEHCGANKTLNCVQLCLGSLQPVAEPIITSFRTTKVSPSPLVALLPDGRTSNPMLMPPIS